MRHRVGPLDDVAGAQHAPVEELRLDPVARREARLRVGGQVADLRRDEHLVASDRTGVDEGGEGAPEAPLGTLVPVVDRRIEDVHAVRTHRGAHRRLDGEVGRTVGLAEVRPQADRGEGDTRAIGAEMERVDALLLGGLAEATSAGHGRMSLVRHPHHGGNRKPKRLRPSVGGRILRPGSSRCAERPMPRRKYGRLRKPIPPLSPDRCRMCRLNRPCPAHPKPSR
jgi:hypothetical protein